MGKYFFTAFLGASLAWCQPPASPLDSSMDFLKKSLQDTNPERRRMAAAALGNAAANTNALQLLYDTMANDKDPEVRQAAAMSLGDLKARAAIPKLKAAMENDPQVSFAAARSLWLMGDRSGKNIIEDEATAQLKDPTGKVAEAKLEASRRLHDPNGLAKMGAEQAASALLGPFSIGLKAATELTKDAGAQARLLALSLLSQQCNPESVSAMETALEGDKNEIVRAGAAKALGICGGPGEINKLSLLVTSEKYPVQLAAAATIIRLSGRPQASLKKK